MRTATVLAGGLVIAAAGMAAAAFVAGGERSGEAPADGEAPGRDRKPSGRGRGGDESPARATPTVTATTVAARDGLEVWARNGCGGCHTFAAANAKGFVGPDLASSLKGVPVAYVKEAIVAPNATVAPGFSAGTMPEDYAQRISPTDLDRLVQFIVGGVRK